MFVSLYLVFIRCETKSWSGFLFCFAAKMPSTHVQRKLEFPVKKRVTRQSKKKAGKEDVENSPVTQAVSPRKRHGEGITHFPMWTLLSLQIERVHLSFEGCLFFFFVTVLSAYSAHLRIWVEYKNVGWTNLKFYLYQNKEWSILNKKVYFHWISCTHLLHNSPLTSLPPFLRSWKNSANVVHLFEFCLLPWRFRILLD